MGNKARVVPFRRRRRARTRAARIAEWLRRVVPPARNGNGVLLVDLEGTLFEGRMLPTVLVDGKWRPPSFTWTEASARAKDAVSLALRLELLKAA